MFGFGLKPREEGITKRAVNAAIRERMRGIPGIFGGFWLNAKEKEAIIKGAITDVTLGLMLDLLIRVTYELGVAHGFIESEVKTKPLLERQRKIIMGFGAVRMRYDPHGPNPISDPIAEGGAKVADAACYMASLTGTFDSKCIAADLRYLLGFCRDGSEIRQDA